MLSCKKLEMPQIESVYRQWMRKDFPPDELKPLQMIKKALNNGTYLCLGLFDDDILCGYAYFVINRAELCCYLLDYFAIDSLKRGTGLGTKFLALLKETVTEPEIILCEAENPDFCKDESERHSMKRRIDFYLCGGFTDSDISARVFGVEYRILEFLNSHDISVVKESYDSIYRSFLPVLMYKTNIKIRYCNRIK